MPIRLVPPRTGRSPYWTIRGTLYGRTVDASTKATDKKTAQKFKERFELELAKDDQRRRSPTTFAVAADMYVQYRQPKKWDKTCIERLVGVIGEYRLIDLQQHILIEAANELYPDAAASTKNRQVIVPAAAILHYAAENNLCPYIQVKKFKERTPEPRAVSKEIAQALITGSTGEMRLLLVWLFYQGWRISDVLRLQWAHINTGAAIVRYRISKTDDWRDMPLHPRVLQELESYHDRVGKVFHWSDKSNLYRDLRPICKRLGIRFTPHMARHSFATWLANAGASPMELMEAGGWKDHKSVLRYAKLDPTRVRATINKIV